MARSQQAHQEGSVHRKTIPYWLDATRWSILILLVFELVVRNFVMLLPRYEYKPGWGLVPVPNSFSIQGREGYGVIHFLEDGEVRTPYEGGTSIVVLGDSTVRAAQVDDTDNFVSLAEVILRGRGIEADLHNLGGSEHVVADHVYNAPAIISKYDPEYVIIQVSVPSFSLSFSAMHDNHFVTGDNGKLELVHQDSGGKGLAFNNVVYSSGLLSFLDYRWQNTRGQLMISNPVLNLNFNVFKENPQASPEEVEPQRTSPITQEEILLQVEALKNAYHGIEIIFMVVPYTPTISPGPDRELSWVSGGDNLLALALSEVEGVRVVYIRDEFQRLYERQHVLPRGSFNSEFNFGHLNRYGHRVVARTLANALEALLK